jgi:hypothetical protein
VVAIAVWCDAITVCFKEIDVRGEEVIRSKKKKKKTQCVVIVVVVYALIACNLRVMVIKQINTKRGLLPVHS